MPDQAGNRNIDHFLLCTLETKNRNSPFPAFHGCGLSNEKTSKGCRWETLQIFYNVTTKNFFRKATI